MVVDQLAAGLLGVPVPVAGPGRLPAPRRPHPVAAVATLDAGLAWPASCSSWSASAGDADGFREAHDGADPPLTWLPAPVSTRARRGRPGPHRAAASSAPAFAVRARLRQSTGDDRLQLLWLVWGAPACPLALVLAWVAHFLLDDSVAVVDLALTLAGVALPITHRHRDPAAPALRHPARAQPHADLRASGRRRRRRSTPCCSWPRTGCSATAPSVGLLAVGVVAVAVHPAYSWLRRPIERWVYGYRSDPAAALRRLGASVESADPLHVVDAITASVADALKVGPRLGGAPGGRRAARGPPPCRWSTAASTSATWRSRCPPGRTLSAADPALLHDLARHAAVIVRAAQLAVSCRVAVADRDRPRGGAQAAAPRPARRRRARPWPAIVLKLNAAQSRRETSSATRSSPRPARRPRLPSRRSDGSSMTCGRPRSTRSAWSARSASGPRRCRPARSSIES